LTADGLIKIELNVSLTLIILSATSDSITSSSRVILISPNGTTLAINRATEDCIIISDHVRYDYTNHNGVIVTIIIIIVDSVWFSAITLLLPVSILLSLSLTLPPPLKTLLLAIMLLRLLYSLFCFCCHLCYNYWKHFLGEQCYHCHNFYWTLML
jgi:hypothetical protein